MVVEKKKQLSPREITVVRGVKMGAGSKAEILKKAGYGKSTQRKPARVFDKPEIQEAIAPIIDRLVRHRDRALERMEALVGKAGYTSLSITVANMNKDIELLSGRPTAREEYVLPPEEQAKIDKLLELNK